MLQNCLYTSFRSTISGSKGCAVFCPETRKIKSFMSKPLPVEQKLLLAILIAWQAVAAAST